MLWLMLDIRSLTPQKLVYISNKKKVLLAPLYNIIIFDFTYIPHWFILNG
jgi:hypothetical protein